MSIEIIINSDVNYIGMEFSTSRGAIQSPERVDTIFGLVSGLYVASLISPAILLIVAERLNTTTAILALGAFVVTISAIVCWSVKRRSDIVSRFDSPWMAWLLPLVGAVPVFGYIRSVITYVAIYLSDDVTVGAANVIGLAGFLMGIVATFMGSALVLMARKRLANASVDEAEVSVEWRAAWPQPRRFWVLLLPLLTVVPIVGLGSLWLLDGPIFGIVIAFPLLVALIRLGSERTYRVTPAGLEQRLLFSCRLLPWSQFDGFRVTNDAIVIQQPLPHINIFISRSDIYEQEEAIISALEKQLHRLD